MPGRSPSGYHRPGKHRVHQATKREAIGMKGELHPTENHLKGGLPHLVRPFLHINYSFEKKRKKKGMATAGGGVPARSPGTHILLCRPLRTFGHGPLVALVNRQQNFRRTK